MAIDDPEARSLLTGTHDRHVQERFDAIAAHVDLSPTAVVFRIGRLGWDGVASRQLAVAVAGELCAALVRRGAPPHMRVEVDDVQGCRIEEGRRVRTLLPHHDSAHCSYLTPSSIDDPTWTPELRQFSPRGITTTQTHKLYQGFFLADPGEARSVTGVFDKVQLVRDAYVRATGDTEPVLSDVARWMGERIREVWEGREQAGQRYLTLAGSLGARQEVLRRVPAHWAEADFEPEVVERYPELERYRTRCDGAAGPSERLLDAGLRATLGIGWCEFCTRYERCVEPSRFDLVVSHNLVNVHAGHEGGRSRALAPVCLVVDEASGEHYERWLAAAWATRWDRLPPSSVSH